MSQAMTRAMTQRLSARFSLVAAAAVGLLAGAPAAGDHRLNLVPVDHRPPPLRVKIWTDRGPDALYYPGESVCVRFTTNDDAYVCVYNIDTEGHVRILFPARGDDGFVSARQVVTLPGPYASYDLVVSGPPGIETVEAIASRAALTGWDDAWEGDDEEWEVEEWEDDDGDEEWEDEEDWDDEENGEDEDNWEDRERDESTWGAGQRLERRSVPRPRATGLTVSGDPFVAIRRVNRRLLGSRSDDRDYDTAYVSFCVGQRVSYPRYACNDCHGSYHGYDPYSDHCSVFSVRVNVNWGYPRHHVYVVHRHVLEPRYIYIRHRNAPHRYKHLKRTWTSHEHSRLKKEFAGTPAWKSAPKVVKRERPRLQAPPAGGSKPGKPGHNYRSKVERRSGRWGEVEKPRSTQPRREWKGEVRRRDRPSRANGKASEAVEAPRRAKVSGDGSGKSARSAKWKGDGRSSKSSPSAKPSRSSKSDHSTSSKPNKSGKWKSKGESGKSRGR